MLYGRAAGIEAAEEVGSDLGCLLLTAVELSPAAAGKERREPVERPPQLPSAPSARDRQDGSLV